MKKRKTLHDSTPAARIRHKVAFWCIKLKVCPKQVRIQHMRWKWGSCSVSGIITLAIDLDEQDSHFQDYVIVHELLHLRIRNHGRLFKSVISAYIPGWKDLSQNYSVS